ncbi:hypothetical protein HanXRQr2_Chr02g0057531 [Helianthus annuus]|uniref:Uncharacterized protein n=1 Tax=Helianthus annuus TaxID=4232 RepID=A0A9K3JNQ9_HELAN|nr:hypothetical protein HanXRQr2_Chr02g0057531 [Helianthus annuus]KAJ0951184.1 hypothetical protein HanPSC8_Chr02g0056971 [Helianthus annuus]
MVNIINPLKTYKQNQRYSNKLFLQNPMLLEIYQTYHPFWSIGVALKYFHHD